MIYYSKSEFTKEVGGEIHEKKHEDMDFGWKLYFTDWNYCNSISASEICAKQGAYESGRIF